MAAAFGRRLSFAGYKRAPTETDARVGLRYSAWLGFLCELLCDLDV